MLLKIINSVSIKGDFHVLLTGKGGSGSSGLVISSADIPDGVELSLTVSEEIAKPELPPATGVGSTQAAQICHGRSCLRRESNRRRGKRRRGHPTLH